MSSQSNDTASIQLEFKNGSIGTIHYFANGPKSFSKERSDTFKDFLLDPSSEIFQLSKEKP